MRDCLNSNSFWSTPILVFFFIFFFDSILTLSIHIVSASKFILAFFLISSLTSLNHLSDFLNIPLISFFSLNCSSLPIPHSCITQDISSAFSLLSSILLNFLFTLMLVWFVAYSRHMLGQLGLISIQITTSSTFLQPSFIFSQNQFLRLNIECIYVGISSSLPVSRDPHFLQLTFNTYSSPLSHSLWYYDYSPKNFKHDTSSMTIIQHFFQ